MRPGKVLMELTRMGFRFRLDGEVVKVKYEGDQEPNKAKVSPLLNFLRGDRDAVREFLRCYCPKCGGVVFVGDNCFLCDWLPKTMMSQAQESDSKDEILFCGECAHFTPSRLNPTYGFGLCALEHLSKRPGAYPAKAACNHFEFPVGELEQLRLLQ
jgi:hypothetical protein